jgi:hypothetical protein
VIETHWVSGQSEIFLNVKVVSVSPGLFVIAKKTEVIYLGRYALIPTRTVLSTVSETASTLRCLLEFSSIIEIVALAAVYGLDESVQESRRGIRTDDAMISQVAFLNIGLMLLEKFTARLKKENYHIRI